jgi:integrase
MSLAIKPKLAIKAKVEVDSHFATLDKKAAEYFSKSKADNTKKAYQTDWRDFEEWCFQYGCQAMPADVLTVVRYLTDRITHPWERIVNKRAGRDKELRIEQVIVTFEPLKVASVERKLSSISKAHEFAGHKFDRKNILLKELILTIRKEKGSIQDRKTPLLLDDVKEMAKSLASGSQGVRDHCLILLGFTGALRRSEIVNLQIDDLKERKEGYDLMVRFSKTDQKGEGMAKIVPYGSSLISCPVRALKAWLSELSAAGIASGPLFRSIDRHGNISHKALCTASVSLIIKRNEHLQDKAGDFGAHSLRAGFCTQAAMNGVPDAIAMKQSGHKDADTYGKYVRTEDMWRNGAAMQLGL